MRKRVSRWFAAAILLAGLACSDNPVRPLAPYSYEGCEDSNTECPGEAAFLCAVNAIAAKHGACKSRNDCVAAGPDAGYIFPAECVNPCVHAAVNKTDEQAYLAETKIETYRYCNQANCTAYPFCPRPTNAIIDCVDGGDAGGFCGWVEGQWKLADAGRLDAAQPGLDATPPPPPGLDASSPPPPGLDAAAPGLDAAPAPGLDAAPPPGPDAAPPGLDAEAPGLDAEAPGVDAAPAGSDV